MPRIDREVIECRLNINLNVKPMIQRKRNLGKGISEAARNKIKKLLDSGFIREVWYARA